MAAVVSAAAIAVPATASAIIIAPPGKAGANQYFETIPSSDGNAAPPGTSGAVPLGSGSLAGLGAGRAGAAQLAKLGKTGKAAAALAAATAPAHPRGGAGRSASATGPGSFPSAHGGSSLSAIIDALTGSDNGGLGALVPILMVLAVLLFALAVVTQRRRRAEPPSAPN